MPRRNNNAVKPRTRNRSTTKMVALRNSDGSTTLVTPITRPDTNGTVIVDLNGSTVAVHARQLISI